MNFWVAAALPLLKEKIHNDLWFFQLINLTITVFIFVVNPNLILPKTFLYLLARLYGSYIVS